MRSIRDVLSQDGTSLKVALALSANEARFEVQMLLQNVLKVSRAWLLAHPEQILEKAQAGVYAAMFRRRLQGEPIAHILGEREFFGLNFRVTPATLIPRPETELLVELALQKLPQGRACRVLDLGTGSGAIAISIAHSRPDVDVLAVDASEAALRIARKNAERLDVHNVSFVLSDWFSELRGQRFDLIVSNPPYIELGDAHLTQGDVRFEPSTALVSGIDGLDDIRRIVDQARDFIEHGGWLLLEHGYNQVESVQILLRQSGFAEVFSVKDIAGIERVSGGMVRP